MLFKIIFVLFVLVGFGWVVYQNNPILGYLFIFLSGVIIGYAVGEFFSTQIKGK